VIVLRDEQELIATRPADHGGRLTNRWVEERPDTGRVLSNYAYPTRVGSIILGRIGQVFGPAPLENRGWAG
jgi:hypothetical protein